MSWLSPPSFKYTAKSRRKPDNVMLKDINLWKQQGTFIVTLANLVNLLRRGGGGISY